MISGYVMDVERNSSDCCRKSLLEDIRILTDTTYRTKKLHSLGQS